MNDDTSSSGGLGDILQVAGGNKSLVIELDPDQMMWLGLVLFGSMFLAVFLALLVFERVK